MSHGTSVFASRHCAPVSSWLCSFRVDRVAEPALACVEVLMLMSGALCDGVQSPLASFLISCRGFIETAALSIGLYASSRISESPNACTIPHKLLTLWSLTLWQVLRRKRIPTSNKLAQLEEFVRAMTANQQQGGRTSDIDIDRIFKIEKVCATQRR